MKLIYYSLVLVWMTVWLSARECGAQSGSDPVTSARIIRPSIDRRDSLTVYTSLSEALKSPGKVKALALSDPAQANSPQLGKLRNLQVLSLSGCGLGQLPASVTRLTNLQALNLSANHLRTFPQELLSLPHLRILILNQNQLDSLPENMDRMRNLRTLHVIENRLTRLPASLKKMTLTDLQVRGNQLEDPLSHWELSQTPLFQNLEHALAHAEKVYKLELSDINSLSGEDLKNL